MRKQEGKVKWKEDSLQKALQHHCYLPCNTSIHRASPSWGGTKISLAFLRIGIPPSTFLGFSGLRRSWKRGGGRGNWVRRKASRIHLGKKMVKLDGISICKPDKKVSPFLVLVNGDKSGCLPKLYKGTRGEKGKGRDIIHTSVHEMGCRVRLLTMG